MSHPFGPELAAALAAAEEAAGYVLAEYESFEAVPDAPADISTAVDRGSQEMILARLRREFPEDAFCAEEGGVHLGEGGRTWVIDPIDGTRGFARKNGQFSIMVALRVGDSVLVGVVAEPVQGRVTYAARGGGCHARVGAGPPVPCQVTGTAELSESVLLMSHSRPDRPWAEIGLLGPKSVAETYSAGVKLAAVARGEGDLYVNPIGISDWDICAGQLLVEEAGGRVTDLSNRPIRYGGEKFYQGGGLLASNGRLHDKAVRRLA